MQILRQKQEHATKEGPRPKRSTDKEEEKLKEENQCNCDHFSEESDNEALYSNQKTETTVGSVILIDALY